MTLLENLRTALMRSSRTFVWTATALGLTLLFSFFAAVAYDFYTAALQASKQAASNVAALTERDIARNIELYDLSLRAVMDGIHDKQIMGQDPELRQKILFDRSADAKGLGALVALDEKGSIFADSRSVVPRAGNFVDREYFAVHRDSERDVGLYVSRPFHARLQGESWNISVSRRITRPDGSFGGIVSGTIKIDYIQQLFDKVALGAQGAIALLRDDGTLIARNVPDDSAIGNDWRNAPVFAHLSQGRSGTFVSDRSMDGVPRVYAFRRVDGLPLVVVVGISTYQTFAPWRSKILVLTAIFVIMAMSVTGLVWMLETELRRRAAAEKAAEELAGTDGLTKVANRRRFEERLSREWAIAARNGEPISLVMIDADHFKLFNDTHGHQAGDHTLAAVAGAMAKALRRPSDLAARYGGEEFVALLPNTNAPGAMQVGAAIRDAIGSLRIDHSASRHRIVTVSVGVATAMPSPGTSASALVRDADAALYRAKAQGRNIVCASNVVPAKFDPQAGIASRAG